MISFSESMAEYQKILQQGSIQVAYKGLMDYMLALRAFLKNKYPHYSVPGSLYFGYMDMTYFSFTPESFKNQNLKVAIVFLHEAFRFEVWLAGVNKQVQTQYWQKIQHSGWKKYPLVASPQGADAILEHIVAENPDFGNLDALTEQIERGTLQFIADIEAYLSGAIPVVQVKHSA